MGIPGFRPWHPFATLAITHLSVGCYRVAKYDNSHETLSSDLERRLLLNSSYSVNYEEEAPICTDASRPPKKPENQTGHMRFVSSIFLLFAFSANLFSQDLPPFVLRKSITVDNGLIQSSVSAIVQDKSGYLWLGTQKGVSRWNGREIVSFSEENGLTKNNVRSLFCRANGDVVIGTFSGVSVYGKNGMITLRDPGNRLSDKIYAIYETNDSSLVFGTDKNGVVVLKNNKFTYLNKESGLASNSIVAIIEDDAGSILFGSKNNGMSVLTKGIITNVNISHGLVSNGIISFLKDNDGSILITADAGICRYNKGKINTIIRDEKLSRRYLSRKRLSHCSQGHGLY